MLADGKLNVHSAAIDPTSVRHQIGQYQHTVIDKLGDEDEIG